MATEDHKRGDLLRKVRGLLDKADGEESLGHVEAAQNYRLKADELMVKYAIEEFELAFDKNAGKGAILPERRDFDYGKLPEEIRRPLIKLFGALARHCGVLLGEYAWSSAVTIGYPQDLDYLEMLYTGLRLHMSANITPRPNRELGYDASLALLKESGRKWKETYLLLLPVFPERFTGTVADVMKKDPGHYELLKKYHEERHPDTPWAESATFGANYVKVGDCLFFKEVPRPIGVRFTKEYTNFCERTSRDRIYSDPQVYLASFVDGYTNTINDRLWEMDRHRKQATTGKELVLVSLNDRLKDFLYELYPDKRPHPPECECDTCHLSKCTNRGSCTRPVCQRARKPIRYAKEREYARDPAAARRGSNIAATADLSGATGRVADKRAGELG